MGNSNLKKAEAKQSKPQNSVAIIKVVAQPEKPFRGNSARACWWERVVKFNGKPLADFEASIAKEAPSQPQKGKLAGKTEKPSGWISFFEGEELIQIVSK